MCLNNLRVSTSLNLVCKETHLPPFVQAWLKGLTLSFPIHSSASCPRLAMGLGSVGPMLRVVNKEESFKKEELRN